VNGNRPDEDQPKEPVRPWRVEVSWTEQSKEGFYSLRGHEGPRPRVAFAEMVGPFLRRDDAVDAAMRAAKERPKATVELVNVLDPDVIAVTYSVHGPLKPVPEPVDHASPSADLQRRASAMSARARADRAATPDQDRFGRRP
jgi:hypothetical protein